MLKLERIFSLTDDILPLLPPVTTGLSEVDVTVPVEDANNTSSNYREPHRWGAPPGSLQQQERNVKLVGQERFGVVLFTWDGYGYERPTSPEKKTFIEMYEIPTRRRTLLYTHHIQMNVVHCSVNQDRNLLVFTLFQRNRVQQDEVNGVETEYEDIYETCMVEIQPQSRLFLLGTPSRKFQRVQFLDGEGIATIRTKQSKAVYYLLFIVHKEYVHAYSLPMAFVKTNQRSCWRIVEQPRKEYSVAKRFLWFQWEMSSQTLYYVYIKPNPKDQSSRVDYMLRAVCFGEDGKSDVSLDVPIPLKFKRGVTEDHEYLHIPCSRAIPDMHFHMEILRIDANALCACFQSIEETSGKMSRAIHVTVFLVNRLTKLEFVIPMNNLPPDVINLTRVCFTTLDNMLLIFLPGHFLQLVDCGSEHDPCQSLVFTGSELVTSLPDQQTDMPQHPTYLTQFEVIQNDQNGFGYALYDCRFDRGYRYSFSEEAILAVFAKTTLQAAHVQALHLSLVHVANQTLATKIFRHLCDFYPHFATPDVLKEFLIGSTYMAMKLAKCDPAILKLLPVTSIQSYNDDSLDDRRSIYSRASSFVEDFPSIRRMTGSSSDSMTKRSLTRFTFDTLNSPTSLTSTLSNSSFFSSTPPPSQSLSGSFTVRKRFDMILGRFFGSTGTDATPSTKQKSPTIDEDDEDIPMRQRFTVALTDFISASLPKEPKSKCAHWATEYSKCQFQQSAQLWSLVDDTKRLPNINDLKDSKPTNDVEHQAMFQLLESLYCALEELHFPFPNGFHTKFAVLGFHCLQRHVFMQYLDRGVFRMTDSFLEHVIVQLLSLSTSPADYHFKAQLISRMRSKNKALRMMRKLPENDRFMADMAISMFMSDVELSDDDEELDANVVMNLDGLTVGEAEVPEDERSFAQMDHNFIPFNVFLQHLRAKGYRNPDVNVVLKAYNTAFSVQENT